MSEERAINDGRIPGKDGEPDVFIPGNRGAKGAFVLFSAGIIALGIWMIWEPLVALLIGETGEARVTLIIKSIPGEADETIRIRKTMEDQGHLSRFRHFVEVIGEDGQVYEFEMAVNSAQKPYAQVNDTLAVAYFPDREYAYGIKQLRTWAFGIAFITFGIVLFAIALYLFINVGKPIVIDPESEDDLEAEKEAIRRHQERKEYLKKSKAVPSEQGSA